MERLSLDDIAPSSNVNIVTVAIASPAHDRNIIGGHRMIFHSLKNPTCRSLFLASPSVA
jgi:hypothetical protein